jgi:hypothetical protein
VGCLVRVGVRGIIMVWACCEPRRLASSSKTASFRA